MSQKKLITYQLAYLTHIEVALCEQHNTDEAVGAPLGPVTHGLHSGTGLDSCPVCDGYILADGAGQGQVRWVRRNSDEFSL